MYNVAFVGDRLFALLAGGGCSHGDPETPNGIIAVQPDGTWDLLADLSQFLTAHPVANPDLEDYEPDGTWYSLIALDGVLYALDPHTGEIDRVDLAGKITRLVDISASQGHIVSTAICEYHGDFYVGNLSRFPLQQGAAKILKITQRGLSWKLESVQATHWLSSEQAPGSIFSKRWLASCIVSVSGDEPFIALINGSSSCLSAGS